MSDKNLMNIVLGICIFIFSVSMGVLVGFPMLSDENSSQISGQTNSSKQTDKDLVVDPRDPELQKAMQKLVGHMKKEKHKLADVPEQNNWEKVISEDQFGHFGSLPNDKIRNPASAKEVEDIYHNNENLSTRKKIQLLSLMEKMEEERSSSNAIEGLRDALDREDYLSSLSFFKYALLKEKDENSIRQIANDWMIEVKNKATKEAGLVYLKIYWPKIFEEVKNISVN